MHDDDDEPSNIIGFYYLLADEQTPTTGNSIPANEAVHFIKHIALGVGKR